MVIERGIITKSELVYNEQYILFTKNDSMNECMWKKCTYLLISKTGAHFISDLCKCSQKKTSLNS